MRTFSQWIRHSLLLGGAALLVVGCASQSRAPIVDRGGAGQTSSGIPSTGGRSKVALPPRSDRDWRPAYHVVQKGDTLYSIALEYGFDYKEIAEWNALADPNVILIGQQLRLTAPAGWQPSVATTPYSSGNASSTVVTVPLASAETVRVTPISSSTVPLKTEPKALKQAYGVQEVNKKTSTAVVNTRPVIVATPSTPAIVRPAPTPVATTSSAKPEAVATTGDGEEQVRWSWPTEGKVIAPFNEAASVKGIDISGKSGQPVLAAADGKVVYSGSGLRGYGKLVILRHNKTYLSAYAHNDQILVKEGQAVSRGQKIAEMGNTGSDQVKLHFEIRQLGKPVDPQKYLPGR